MCDLILARKLFDSSLLIDAVSCMQPDFHPYSEPLDAAFFADPNHIVPHFHKPRLRRQF